MSCVFGGLFPRTTSQVWIDRYAEALIEESEKKPIVEFLTTFNNIKARKRGYASVEVLLLDTTISFLWPDADKTSRVIKLLKTAYNMLGSSFPNTYKLHISFTFCLIREHQDRPSTYSLFVGHNNHSNAHTPTYRISTYLEDLKDIRSFSRKFIYETNFDDIAHKLYSQSVSPDSKTRIHKIYSMIVSILL